MAVTTAQQRFERHTEEVTASLLNDVGARSGEPALRMWGLKYTAEVDRKRGDEEHTLGRYTLKRVLDNAYDNYFVETGEKIPSEEAMGHGTTSRSLHSETSLEILRAAMGAYGIVEGEGVTFHDSVSNRGGKPAAIASFDLSIPGVEFVGMATNVLTWDAQHNPAG